MKWKYYSSDWFVYSLVNHSVACSYWPESALHIRGIRLLAGRDKEHKHTLLLNYTILINHGPQH